MLADIFPGARVLEAGVGSGRCRWRCCGPGADVVGYELREDFANRANATSKASSAPTNRYRVEERDVYEGIDETDLDRIVLDLPEPWRVVKHAEAALRPGGILVAYLPDHRPGRPAPRGARRQRRSAWPRRSRCCSAPGTSRASRSGPTTAWWPTPASSPPPGCSEA